MIFGSLGVQDIPTTKNPRKIRWGTLFLYHHFKIKIAISWLLNELYIVINSHIKLISKIKLSGVEHGFKSLSQTAFERIAKYCFWYAPGP